MKRVFKTLSAILLACACLVPGLAWAAGPSVTLESNGTLKATDMAGVHSILVEVAFDGANADKVTDVALKNAPSDALASAVYSGGKATIAVSAGASELQLANSSLGTLDVIAQGASAETPVSVAAHVMAVEYLDSPDSTANTKSATVISSNPVTITSTESATPPDDGGDGSSGNGQGQGAGLGSGIEGSGNGIGGNGAGGNNNGATGPADYRANGAVSATQAGASTGGNTGLVKTGDVLAICGIALGAAAIVVFGAMFFARRKASSREE